MGVPSLNDLAVDGMLNTTNHSLIYKVYVIKKLIELILVRLST